MLIIKYSQQYRNNMCLKVARHKTCIPTETRKQNNQAIENDSSCPKRVNNKRG